MKDIKKSQQVEDKREKEKQIVDLMIHLYCRKKHKTVEKHHGLCEELSLIHISCTVFLSSRKQVRKPSDRI